MELLSKIMDWAVALSCLLIWPVCISQVRLLYRLKIVSGISFFTGWGWFVIQLLILIQSGTRKNWPIFFVMLMGLACLFILLVMAHYYHRYPGGKPSE